MIPPSEIEAAKDRLRLPDLLRILNLGGELPQRDGVKFHSPLRPDAHPSCTFFKDGRRMIDWSTGKSYDGIDFLGAALGLRNGEAIRRFVEIANGRPITVEQVPVLRALPKEKTERPNLSRLRKGVRAELQQVANSRMIDVRAVKLAQDMGILCIGLVCGFPSWIITDSSGFIAEGRRLDANSYPAIKDLSGRKAHTFKHSQKNWPVGILPEAPYRNSFDTICIAEGGPDLLSVIHFALAQGRTGILPVALLGRGACRHGLHPDSLQFFRGKRVRIYPHNDRNGGSYESAEILAKQLQQLGCEVDFFVFEGLTKAGGSPMKDLNDCTEIAPYQADRLEGLFL